MSFPESGHVCFALSAMRLLAPFVGLQPSGSPVISRAGVQVGRLGVLTHTRLPHRDTRNAREFSTRHVEEPLTSTRRGASACPFHERHTRQDDPWGVRGFASHEGHRPVNAVEGARFKLDAGPRRRESSRSYGCRIPPQGETRTAPSTASHRRGTRPGTPQLDRASRPPPRGAHRCHDIGDPGRRTTVQPQEHPPGPLHRRSRSWW